MSEQNSGQTFIYWDNSNIFYEAQRFSEEREEGPDARIRVRIHFENMLRLAHADRPIGKAIAVGSVLPEMRQLWNRIENQGVDIKLFDRRSLNLGEQNMPDYMLQLEMLQDGLDNNGNPGIVVLLTGDGAGYYDGAGFHRTIERLHNRGWKIEVLSWRHACNKRMREWAENNGIFVALDDFYEAITFLEPSQPGHEYAPGRKAATLDLARRQVLS